MKIKRHIHSLMIMAIMAYATTGCERDAVVTLPVHTPKLVVHAYVETGTYFRVAVGRSFRSDVSVSTDSTFVNTALVILYENDVVKDTLHYIAAAKRYISSDVIAQTGITYKIRISAPGFETVEASASAPLPVPTVFIQYARNTSVDFNGSSLDDVTFRFSDPSAPGNYYLTMLKGGYQHRSHFCVYSYDPAVENYQSTLNPFENSSCIISDQVLYTDRSFNGSLKQIILSGQSASLDVVTDAATGAVYRPYLKRYMISADFYNYLKSELLLNGIDGDPFVSPVVIKGNIHNGYGVFTVFSAVTDTLR